MTDQPDLFRPSIVDLAERNSEKFPDDFLAWLPKNLHIWQAFRGEAMAVIGKGFEHYSARTIIEFLRHNTAITQRADDDGWKLNDKHTPYLARLFDLAEPGDAGLFEYRKTKKVFTDTPCPL